MRFDQPGLDGPGEPPFQRGMANVKTDSKMPGIVELAKRELRLSTQIGLPNRASFESGSSGVVEFLESPEYAAVLGLVLRNREIRPPKRALIAGDNPVVKFFKNFLP